MRLYRIPAGPPGTAKGRLQLVVNADTFEPLTGPLHPLEAAAFIDRRHEAECVTCAERAQA